jgi:hypothetical protein
MIKQKKSWIIFRIVVASILLLQSVGPLFAHSPGYLPVASPDAQVAEPFPDENAQPLYEQDEFALKQVPSLELAQQADNLVELVPAQFPLFPATTTPDKNQEIAVVSTTRATVTFLNEQLMLVFDEGTFSEEVEVRLRSLPVETEGIKYGSQLRVQIEIIALSTGELIESLSKPVHVVADLSQSDSGNSLAWFIAFQDEANPYLSYQPEAVIHNETGIFSITTNDLTQVMMMGVEESGGDVPSPWRFRWDLPSVSTFSGAATYQYPIELPPGRAGLTPNIDIAYSSRGVDTHIFTDGMDQGPLGLGWSMNNIEITRDKTDLSSDGAHYHWKHGDQFSLVINGSSHQLERISTSGYIRNYYAKDAPGLRIRQIYDDSSVPSGQINQDKLYWTVQTPDGTIYRLGYRPDAETGQDISPRVTPTLLDTTGTQQVGADIHYGGLRWRVDTVTDVHGNQIQYDYYDNVTLRT